MNTKQLAQTILDAYHGDFDSAIKHCHLKGYSNNRFKLAENVLRSMRVS